MHSGTRFLLCRQTQTEVKLANILYIYYSCSLLTKRGFAVVGCNRMISPMYNRFFPQFRYIYINRQLKFVKCERTQVSGGKGIGRYLWIFLF